MTTFTCFRPAASASPVADALASADALAFAEAVAGVVAMAPAKSSYSDWVSSCFQMPFSRTNCVARSELEPSAKVMVR
jgi:hypothetical protein